MSGTDVNGTDAFINRYRYGPSYTYDSAAPIELCLSGLGSPCGPFKLVIVVFINYVA